MSNDQVRSNAILGILLCAIIYMILNESLGWEKPQYHTPHQDYNVGVHDSFTSYDATVGTASGATIVGPPTGPAGPINFVDWKKSEPIF